MESLDGNGKASGTRQTQAQGEIQDQNEEGDQDESKAQVKKQAEMNGTAPKPAVGKTSRLVTWDCGIE